MAYQTGDEILDDHYNGFADDNTNNVNKILGTGSADFGYGQTNTVDTVSAGNTVQASQWNTLLTRMRSIADHQASGITTADSGQLSAGDIIGILLGIVISLAIALVILGQAAPIIADTPSFINSLATTFEELRLLHFVSAFINLNLI